MENRICPNKLDGNAWGCGGYMAEIRSDLTEDLIDIDLLTLEHYNKKKTILKCPLCGYSIVKEQFKIEGN